MEFSLIEPKITKQFLLDHNSEETYMQFYLGIPVKKGLVRNPLREDKQVTCSWFRNKSGELIFKDFSGAFYGNFIDVVMAKYHVTYYQALKIIASDFGLIKTNIPKHKGYINKSAERFEESHTADIKVEIKPYTKRELDWWNSYGVTSDLLNKYQVFSCKTVFLNGNPFISSTKNNLIFGYYGGKEYDLEYWRIYFPLRDSYRFLSNYPKDKVQGLKQLPKKGNLLIITKSLKDVACLRGFGLYAIAPCSENLFIKDGLLTKLKERFKNIVTLYDNDKPGLHNMWLIRKKHPELTYLWIPRKYGAKDISDFRKKYGREKTAEFIKNTILNYKNEIGIDNSL